MEEWRSQRNCRASIFRSENTCHRWKWNYFVATLGGTLIPPFLWKIYNPTGIQPSYKNTASKRRRIRLRKWKEKLRKKAKHMSRKYDRECRDWDAFLGFNLLTYKYIREHIVKKSKRKEGYGKGWLVFSYFHWDAFGRKVPIGLDGWAWLDYNFLAGMHVCICT